MSLFDDIIEAGATLDWISPLASVIGDALNGPGHTFLIPYDDCPMSGREIEKLLRSHRVKTWGAMVVGGTFMLTVPEGRARYAESLLDEQGVPLENPLSPPKRTGMWSSITNAGIRK